MSRFSYHSGAFWLRHKRCTWRSRFRSRFRDPISVAFFDQVALFSDFNHLFWLIGPGFAPYRSSAFYILKLSSKKHFKKAHYEFYRQFSCRKRMFHKQSVGVEWKVCLSHAGSKVAKPIFSNSGKPYLCTCPSALP